MKGGTEMEPARNEAAGPAPPRSAAAAVVQKAFSFPVMLACGLAMVTFLSCRSRVSDPDTWWHLRVGETIWRSKSIPRTDLFSYTTNNHTSIDPEWLAEISIYLAYDLGGCRGLLLWLCLFSSAVFVALYVYCSLYSGNSKISFLGGLLGCFFGSVGLHVRPVVLGHLFLVLELLVLHLGRTKSRRWLWTLPPVFALWANCHGSFVLGLLALGAFGIGSFVDLASGGLVSVRRERRERAFPGVMFALCIAAPALNPIGLQLLSYPFDTLTNQRVGLANISEWQALTVSDPRGVALFGVAGLLGWIVLTRPVQVRLEELVLLLIAFGLALRHIRMLFAFGILTAPILCRLLADAWDRYDPGRDHRGANAALMLGFLAVMLFAFPAASQLDRQVRTENPAGAVEFIRRSGISGPMLNQYEWGGYLMWALPEQKVFVDVRGDIFDWTGVLGAYARWYNLQEDPMLLLNKYRIAYCILSRAAPMSSVLPLLPGWRRVYSDDLAVIFARMQG
jgi:hypothetical protein